jgi:hypothetical protein
VAFVVSATVGQFGVNEVWTGGFVGTAYVSELVALVVGCWVLHGEGWVAMARTHGLHREPGADGRAGHHAM